MVSQAWDGESLRARAVLIHSSVMVCMVLVQVRALAAVGMCCEEVRSWRILMRAFR